MFARIPRMKRGDWAPGLQPDLSLVAMWALILELIVRGVDYVGGDRPEVTNNLTVVEQAFPIQVWGILCLAAGLMFAFGVATQKFGAVIAGSLLATGVYGALAAGLFLRMVERGWPWDGFRTPLMFMVVALLFALYSFSGYLKLTAHRASRHMGVDDEGVV